MTQSGSEPTPFRLVAQCCIIVILHTSLGVIFVCYPSGFEAKHAGVRNFLFILLDIVLLHVSNRGY
jgi:hypothetical protein